MKYTNKDFDELYYGPIQDYKGFLEAKTLDAFKNAFKKYKVEASSDVIREIWQHLQHSRKNNLGLV